VRSRSAEAALAAPRRNGSGRRGRLRPVCRNLHHHMRDWAPPCPAEAARLPPRWHLPRRPRPGKPARTRHHRQDQGRHQLLKHP
jgi:hypothetical protein